MKRFAVIVTKVFFRIFYRVEIVNADKVPAEGPVVVCANHNTMLDMFFLGFRLKRWIHWMAKEELFKNPILAFLIVKLGGFPVKRGKVDVASIKTAYKLLEEGKIVGIFPHGHRFKAGNANTLRVKSGAAMIAANSGASIVPAAVLGNYRLFSRMKIIYGEPFKIDGAGKLGSGELSEISREIVEKINALLEENQ